MPLIIDCHRMDGKAPVFILWQLPAYIRAFSCHRMNGKTPVFILWQLPAYIRAFSCHRMDGKALVFILCPPYTPTRGDPAGQGRKRDTLRENARRVR